MVSIRANRGWKLKLKLRRIENTDFLKITATNSVVFYLYPWSLRGIGKCRNSSSTNVTAWSTIRLTHFWAHFRTSNKQTIQVSWTLMRAWSSIPSINTDKVVGTCAQIIQIVNDNKRWSSSPSNGITTDKSGVFTSNITFSFSIQTRLLSELYVRENLLSLSIYT